MARFELTTNKGADLEIVLFSSHSIKSLHALLQEARGTYELLLQSPFFRAYAEERLNTEGCKLAVGSIPISRIKHATYYLRATQNTLVIVDELSNAVEHLGSFNQKQLLNLNQAFNPTLRRMLSLEGILCLLAEKVGPINVTEDQLTAEAYRNGPFYLCYFECDTNFIAPVSSLLEGFQFDVQHHIIDPGRVRQTLDTSTGRLVDADFALPLQGNFLIILPINAVMENHKNAPSLETVIGVFNTLDEELQHGHVLLDSADTKAELQTMGFPANIATRPTVYYCFLQKDALSIFQWLNEFAADWHPHLPGYTLPPRTQ